LILYLKEIVRKCVINISCLDISEEEATAEVGSDIWAYSTKSVPLNISIKLIQFIDIFWSLTIPIYCSGKVDLGIIQRIELSGKWVILISHHLNEWTISLKGEQQNKLDQLINHIGYLNFLLVVQRPYTHFLKNFFLKMGEVLKISVLSLALNNVLPDLLGIKVHHLHRHVSNCLLIFTVSSVITKYVILEHLVLPNNLDA